ncbi:MAG: dipicolinate synthase subunit B [Cellulosilyticaceae bacterium]
MKELKELKLGVALCGSFCTFKSAVKLIEELVNLEIDVYPIMSFNAYTLTTRFGNANDFIEQIESLTGKPIIHTIPGAEPLGPKNIIDAILIAPCTGNTLAKLAHGIIDTPVLLATKSLMRNGKPVIIAISTNDGLGLNLSNLGTLLPNQNTYFVPFGQDDPVNKPYSLVADLSLAARTVSLAINGQQIQPILVTYTK